MKLDIYMIGVIGLLIITFVITVGGMIINYKSLEVRENACQQCCEEVKR
jgi:hypothetical protein